VKSFAENLVIYPELNIFNACFQLGGDPQSTIFNYKEQSKPLSLFTVPYKDKKDKLNVDLLLNIL
jgi:hypothetical protein